MRPKTQKIIREDIEKICKFVIDYEKILIEQIEHCLTQRKYIELIGDLIPAFKAANRLKTRMRILDELKRDQGTNSMQDLFEQFLKFQDKGCELELDNTSVFAGREKGGRIELSNIKGLSYDPTIDAWIISIEDYRDAAI